MFMLLNLIKYYFSTLAMQSEKNALLIKRKNHRGSTAGSALRLISRILESSLFRDTSLGNGDLALFC